MLLPRGMIIINYPLIPSLINLLITAHDGYISMSGSCCSSWSAWHILIAREILLK